MADGSAGERVIDIDLEATGNRTSRAAGTPVKITGFSVSGLSPGTDESLYIRKGSTTGPLLWSMSDPTGATRHNINADLQILSDDGLFVIGPANAWTKGHLLIYTA